MKRNPYLCAGQVLATLLVLAMVLLLGIIARSPDLTTDAEYNNPQKFHLWTTGPHFSYSFTCDPHASDVWMFRTAEGTMLVLPARPPLSTNPQAGR